MSMIRCDLGSPLGGRAQAVDAQPLADAVADRRARVEAGVRVLEDDLHPPPVRLEGRALDRGQVRAVEGDRARRRLDEAQQQPPDRRLAAARLADEPERLAAPDLEAHAVHGLDHADGALQDAAPDREVLDQVLDLDERAGSSAAAVGAPRPAGQRPRSRPTSVAGAAAGTGTGMPGRGMRPPVASWYSQQRTSWPPLDRAAATDGPPWRWPRPPRPAPGSAGRSGSPWAGR